ncbi:hypothetical protein CcCBS67573_g03531 [Chytriomyces confervae]|uniref:G-protein coupled receptors family 1 profile domain-containing protein n=1 Tax=Chytriomyces confervae TaxID=246404 RepID=A0A507FHL7_9FUNG|nr:hypothetical protein CcCBS67573_g03531 [Chytriomyces confervae]
MSVQARNQIFFICGFFTALSAENTVTSPNDASQKTAGQLANTCFIASLIGLPATFFNNACFEWSAGGCTFYLVYKLVSTGILIFRATILVRIRWRRPLQILGCTALAGSLLTIMAGIVNQTAYISADGYCFTNLNWRRTNDIGKSILVVIYLVLLVCFLVPVVNQIQMIRSIGEGEVGTQRLTLVATSFATRVCLAIVGFIVPQLFPVIFGGNNGGIFSGLEGVGFVAENALAIGEPGDAGGADACEVAGATTRDAYRTLLIAFDDGFINNSGPECSEWLSAAAVLLQSNRSQSSRTAA